MEGVPGGPPLHEHNCAPGSRYLFSPVISRSVSHTHTHTHTHISLISTALGIWSSLPSDSFCHGNSLYSFPDAAAVTNYHKLGRLEQHRFIVFQFLRSEVHEIGLTGIQIKMLAELPSFWSQERKISFLGLSSFWRLLPALTLDPSPSSNPEHLEISLTVLPLSYLLRLRLWLFCLPLSLIRAFFHYFGPIWLIQVNLPISKSFINQMSSKILLPRRWHLLQVT